MSEDSISYVFDFRRVDTFMENINRSGKFDIQDMDGIVKNYRFVLSSSCPDNIVDCLDSDGTLNNSVVRIDLMEEGDAECVLLYNKGINNNATITLGGQSSVNLDVGDGDVLLKAIFLVDDSTGFVIAYSILNRQIPINNEVVLPASGVLWEIRTEAD